MGDARRDGSSAFFLRRNLSAPRTHSLCAPFRLCLFAFRLRSEGKDSGSDNDDATERNKIPSVVVELILPWFDARDRPCFSLSGLFGLGEEAQGGRLDGWAVIGRGGTQRGGSDFGSSEREVRCSGPLRRRVTI